MYPLLTDRPTKFLSFTCPLKVLIQQPVSTDHNFSSLSVELKREIEKVKIQDIIQERERERVKEEKKSILTLTQALSRLKTERKRQPFCARAETKLVH